MTTLWHFSRFILVGLCSVIVLHTTSCEKKIPSKLGLVGSAVSLDESFMNIQKLDDQECIPRLLCEMAASSTKTPLSKEENSILSVFSNEKSPADKNGKSPMSIYKFAIELGVNGSDELRCQKHFSKCPLTGKDLMSAFKSIIISKT